MFYVRKHRTCHESYILRPGPWYYGTYTIFVDPFAICVDPFATCVDPFAICVDPFAIVDQELTNN